MKRKNNKQQEAFDIWSDMFQKTFKNGIRISNFIDWEGQLNAIIKYEDLHWTKKIFTKRPKLNREIAEWIKEELKCK
jgi:hypothetical protein